MNELWLKQNNEISEFIIFKNQTIKNSSSYKFKKYRASRTYYKGPRGGCYYINSNGNKTYVSRSLCN